MAAKIQVPDMTGLSSLKPEYRALIQGASRGIGLALVRALLDDPDCGQVLASCRRPQQSDALGALKHRFGDRLALLDLDVADADSVERSAQGLVDRRIGLDLVVNVAGILHHPHGLWPEKSLDDIEAGNFEQVFRTNAIGPALMLRHFHRLLNDRGKCVFAALSARVGSITDNRLGGWYAYRASKAALNQLLKSAAIELARRRPNAIVVALHPGTTDTGLSAPFQSHVPPEQLFSPERAAAQLLAVIDGLNPADSGGFFAWDGRPIAW